MNHFLLASSLYPVRYSPVIKKRGWDMQCTHLWHWYSPCQLGITFCHERYGLDACFAFRNRSRMSMAMNSSWLQRASSDTLEPASLYHVRYHRNFLTLIIRGESIWSLHLSLHSVVHATFPGVQLLTGIYTRKENSPAGVVRWHSSLPNGSEQCKLRIHWGLGINWT